MDGLEKEVKKKHSTSKLMDILYVFTWIMVCVCVLCCKGSVAYVAQEAWVQNATLRDNVLFGKPMNTAIYDKIIDACALRPDIEEFPGKDLTEIGEKVFN